MSTLTFLGVWMTPEKGETTCFYLDLEDTDLLVDCGMNIVRDLKKIDVDSAEIENLMITHNHADHVSSFPNYLFYRFGYLSHFLEKEPEKLNLITKRENFDKLIPVIKEFYSERMFDNVKEFLNIREIGSDFSSLKISDRYKLTFTTTKHTKLTTAFRLDDLETGLSLAYSADTAPCGNVKKLAKGADILIHETIGDSSFKEKIEGVHTTSRDVGNIAQETGVDVLMPVHRMTIFKGKEEKMKSEIREDFNGRVVFPDGLDSFELEKL